MDGEFTYQPKWDPIGFDPLVCAGFGVPVVLRRWETPFTHKNQRFKSYTTSPGIPERLALGDTASYHVSSCSCVCCLMRPLFVVGLGCGCVFCRVCRACLLCVLVFGVRYWLVCVGIEGSVSVWQFFPQQTTKEQ